MNGRASAIARVSGMALAIALCAPGVAFAQDGDVQQVEEDEAENVIVVTGTSIRGAPPVGSSLIQLGRAEIEATVGSSATQIVQEIPQIFNFGVNESARNQSGGAGNIVYGSSINIRGIGPYATLTLLNGRRAVPQGTLGASVDPGNIPAIALQRVEVIADGASAVYGSDAVAGVANLILRRDYEGLGVDAQYGFGDNYHTYNVNAIAGTDWGSGRMTIAGQHHFRSNLAGVDRDFYTSDLTPFGGSDYLVGNCDPGTMVISGVNYAIPESGATPSNLIAGTSNRCDNLKLTTDILPEVETNSATFTFDQDITDSIHFFADGLYAKRDAFRRSASAEQAITVPATNAFFVSPSGVTLPSCPSSAGAPTGTQCLTINYNLANLFGGNSISDIESEVWQLTGGFDVSLSEDWNVNLYGTFGRDHDHVFSQGGSTNVANLAAALRSSDPATALNPFGTSGGNSDATIASVFDNLTDTDGKSRYFDTGITLDGTLFSLPGGDVRIAVGGQYNELRLRTGQIRGAAGSQTGTDSILRRSVTSGFAEVLIPIFGPDNAIPGFQSLELNIAGRIDEYSDVGSTTNPKFGINWEPIDDLKLHASYGESFRAPLLTQITSAGGSRLFAQNYFDPTVNATVAGVALSGGNLGLVPETARTWSVGLDYTPASVPGLQFSLNYFDLVYEGQVASYLSDLNLLRKEEFFGSIILRGAEAQARAAELLEAGIGIGRGTEQQVRNAPVFVDGRTNNLGTTSTTGIDFGLVVPIDGGEAGDFRVTFRGLRFFTYDIAYTPGGTVTDQLNNIDNPLKFKARLGLSWDQGPFTLNTYVNYTNGYNNTLASPVERISASTTVDLSASYDLADMLPVAERVSIGVNVLNLFDEDPPFVDIAPTNNGGGGFDPANASPLGRVVSLVLRTEF